MDTLLDLLLSFWEQWLLGVLTHAGLGVVLGVVWAQVFWSFRPFARRHVPGTVALLALAIGIAGVVAVTLLAEDGMHVVDVGALSIGGLGGIGLLTIWLHRDRGPGGGVDSIYALTDAEIRRSKDTADRWVLVWGWPTSGKTALIDAMLQELSTRPVGRGGWRAIHAPRTTHEAGGVIAEVSMVSSSGAPINLRVIETSRLDLVPSGRGLGDMDAIVMVLDPTQLEGLAETFSASIRPHGNRPIEGDRLILALASAIAQAGNDAKLPVWAVISKSDLLRFSIAPQLIEFPIVVGPGWRDQMERMMLNERRRLGTALGLAQLSQEQVAFEWGGGSPILLYHPPGSRRPTGRAFGAGEVMEAILNVVA